ACGVGRVVRPRAGGRFRVARLRPFGVTMIILGLTGSVGMGKSTAARLMRRMGIPVYDADRAVHRLLGRGGAGVAPVGAAFPEVLKDGIIDRAALGRRGFADAAALRRLE